MAALILHIMAAILAIIGITEIICGIRLAIHTPEEMAQSATIVFLDEKEPSQQLVYLLKKAEISGHKYSEFIIAVDCGLTEEDLKECKKIAQLGAIIICPLDEVELRLARLYNSYE